MKQKIILLYSAFLLATTLKAQDTINVNQQVTTKNTQANSNSVYHVSFKKDAPVIIAGIGLTYLGNSLIKNKDELTLAELATKTRDKVPFFDRGNVGYYDSKIDKDSYIPFLGSFAMPVVMGIINKNMRNNFGRIGVMYIESLSITGALFTMAAGTFNRPRPLVYAGTSAPTDERINKNNQRSFYAGHTASTASATFFAAKVFHDLNPNSKAKPFVWVVAAAVPAVVGYMRYKSGFHFLSDNLLGYVVGAASGILIPEWHKKSDQNLSFVPQLGKDYKGIALVYSIK
jgi:membrane-associated phospholipid phosphatase